MTADVPAAPSFKKSVAREYLESLVVAFILATFIRTFVVQAFKIPTGSMENNLLIGDRSSIVEVRASEAKALIEALRKTPLRGKKVPVRLYEER